MPDLDAIVPPAPTPEPPAPPVTPEPPVVPEPDPAALIASYKARQAGADAARDVALGKLAAQEAELAAFRLANRTAGEKDLSELATYQARLAAETKRADEADAKAEGKILDSRFPLMRKDFPNETNEVVLAKYEAIMAEESNEPPTPLRNNGPKPPLAPEKAKSFDDMVGDLKKIEAAEGIPWGR